MTDSPLTRRFPIPAFNPFHGGRMAWRIGMVAEYFLSVSPRPRVNARPRIKGFRYITMAGKAHLLQLRESLLSMARCWSALPEVTILSDGSWNESEFRPHFDWWPGELHVCMPDTVRSELRQLGQEKLAEFTLTHPLSLKLGFIVAAATREKVFFVDSDILWIRNPIESLQKHNWEAGVAASVETGGTFNRELAARVCPSVLSPPFVNTGMVLLAGELFRIPGQLEEILSGIENRGHEFNEQTMIAIAVRMNGQTLATDFLVNDFSNPFEMKTLYLDGKRGLARHYVRFMRHLLYRDALLLRCYNLL